MIPVSVIVCTRNRAAQLASALSSLKEQRFDGAWQLIVVNNGSSDHTQEVLAHASGDLPLTVLNEPVPGKSRALNRGLQAIRGELIAFTDDDVRVSPEWLQQLGRAAADRPPASVFCGPIIPVFAQPVPSWLKRSRFASLAFAKFEPRQPEGPLWRPLLPFGPNMAVRAAALSSMRFREDLGPGTPGAPLCEDTEFAQRFERRGEELFFVPRAVVAHHIRPELLSVANLLERAFGFGRSTIVMERKLALKFFRPYLNGIYPHALQPGAPTDFDIAMTLNVACGQMYQLVQENQPRLALSLIGPLEILGWGGQPEFLSRSAATWLRTVPNCVPACARHIFDRPVQVVARRA